MSSLIEVGVGSPRNPYFAFFGNYNGVFLGNTAAPAAQGGCCPGKGGFFWLGWGLAYHHNVGVHLPHTGGGRWSGLL